MRRKTRAKIKRVLTIIGAIIGVLLIILGIIWVIKLNQEPEISYDDGITCKNYFTEITINFEKQEVKRDNIETSLEEEFNISTEQSIIAYSSIENMRQLLSDSTFSITEDNQIFKIKNQFQTKSIIVQADEIKDKVEEGEVIEITDNLYILSFYSEKLTKAMYDYYKEKDYVRNVFYDDVFINKQINDISQTMYGQIEVDLNNHHSLGATKMGFNNYIDVINENGNPSNIVISTIGYGINYQNEFFNERIDENHYNFILNNQDISETISQGSRIAEVLVDSTTPNVKIMPLVTVTEEGYSTISSIIKALKHAIDNSDVICYELINGQNDAIDIVLESAFRENVPICSVLSKDEQNYPANHAMTIAVSSLDRELNITEYSDRGDYIDFSAPSTDVEEIFNKSLSISRWSGPQYSNAQVVAAIALIKTYSKDATILEIYNFLRNFCIDLGEEGKDKLFGYGCPNFENITIADIDKQTPEIKEVIYENENWEILKQVKIIANDNIRIRAWAITREEEPTEGEWKVLESVTSTLDVTTEIVENGIYSIWVQDTAGNIATQVIQIDKVDNTPPEIAYTIDKENLASGTVTMNVTSEDTQSGLSENAFSWDKRSWSQENNTRTVKENGRYKVYVQDSLGNIGEKEILVDCFPQEGRYELGEGNIITAMTVSSSWTDNKNNNIKITLNKELDIAGWQITTSVYVPEEFVEVRQETITNNSNIIENTTTTDENNNTENTNISNEETTQVILPRTEPIVVTTALNINTTYYLWIKDSNGNTTYQTFNIYKAPI